MDTASVVSAMKTLTKKTKTNFIGVFPSDQLPESIQPTPSCLIYNTHPHNLPGEHWVAIFFPADGQAEHFCSYGQSPVSDVKEYLENMYNSEWRCNRRRVQGYLSSACGSHAVYFLKQRVMGKTMTQIVGGLQKMGSFVADSFVVAYVNKFCLQKNEVFEKDVIFNQICTAFSMPV